MGHSAAAARLCALPVIHHRKGRSTMATKALLVRLEAKSGKEDAVEEFLFGTAARRAGTRHETVVRGSVRPVDVRHHRRVPGRGGTRDASWRARWKGPRGESRRALRLGTRHQQSRRYRQQALTPSRGVYASTGQALWATSACWGRCVRRVWTDRTMSTAASGCEGSHVDGPRRHIRAGVAPKGDKTGIGRGAFRSRSGAGQRSAGPP